MSNDDIKAMTVRELRELCKGDPLYAGYSKCKRKAELVEHIIKCLECEVLVAEFECRDCIEEDITIEECQEAIDRAEAILAKPEELADSEKAIAQLAPNPLVEFLFMACRVVYAFCAVSWGIAYQAGKLTYKAGYTAGSVTRKVRNGFALAGMIAKRSPLLQLSWAY